MARPFQSGEIRGNMAESLARRPAVAIGSTPPPPQTQYEGRGKFAGACTIEIGRVVPDPDQPRKTFTPETLDQLAASMKTRGQLIPVLVRWTPEVDRYTLIDGERRYRAALQAGLPMLTAIDITNASEDEVLEIQLVTNALRDDVPAVEQARSWRKLMDARGLSQRDLAEKLGYDHSTITRALGLLNLPESIQASVDAGDIRPQTGYELSRIKDPAEQAELAEQAKIGKLKRDELREKVAASNPVKSAAGSRKPKGRGASKAKPKLPTTRTIRTDGGFKVTVERSRGFDPASLVTALREALAKAEAEQGGEQVAA